MNNIHLFDSTDSHSLKVSDHQLSWEYADGPWKGLGPPLPLAADF